MDRIKNEPFARNCAILFLCHIVNEQTICRFNRLCADLGCHYDIFWGLQTDEQHNVNIPEGIKFFKFCLEDLNSLGYVPLTHLYGSEHYIIEYFFKLKCYMFYWVIEYDVHFSGDWKFLLNYYKNNDSDFISSHIERKSIENYHWPWWNTFECSAPYQSFANNLIKSFNPLYRISHRALKILDSYLINSNCRGFYEVIISTILYNNGCVIEDFGGYGEFTPKENIGKFYIPKIGINNGSIRWRPIITTEELALTWRNNTLYHPLKLESFSVSERIKGVKARIVYVIVSENEEYVNYLHLSMYSLLRNNKCDIIVLTDETTCLDSFIMQYADVIRIHIPGTYSTRMKSRFLKTQIGLYVEGTFLYLDCDTIILGSIEDIDSIKADIACAVEYNNPYVYDDGYSSFNTEKVGYILQLDRMSYFNSGVIFSSGSNKSKLFFQNWHKNWMNYALSYKKEIDQPAMYKTNCEMNHVIRRLPDKYNWIH